jgi:hypothetical protein
LCNFEMVYLLRFRKFCLEEKEKFLQTQPPIVAKAIRFFQTLFAQPWIGF